MTPRMCNNNNNPSPVLSDVVQHNRRELPAPNRWKQGYRVHSVQSKKG